MDKLKKGLKHLFAPAIVLLLVAIVGVFSPVVSVAAALRLNTADATSGSATTMGDYTIQNLPARTVKVGTELATLPSIDVGNSGKTGVVKVYHAGKGETPTGAYSYSEVGQYEWRFYIKDGDNETLFDTYKVTVTDTSYSMTMPDVVPTVAPKGLDELELPLPSGYTVGGDTMQVAAVKASDKDHAYAVVTLKKDKDDATETGTTYRLSAIVALENDTFDETLISIDANHVTINLSNYKDSTGNLKVTYLLSSDADNSKKLVAVPLTDIEIKNVTKNEVTFANIPTAPSVSNLSYYSTVALTAPTADSAMVAANSFSVEAQSSIVKVQAYLFATEPSSWTKKTSDIITLTLGADGKWSSSSDKYSASDLIEIEDLNVKVKALGWYRFQFQTSTLFGYQMGKDFDNYDAIEQDADKTYVRYWSDSIRIYRDSIEPNFAWVANYALKTEGDKVVGYSATVDGKEVDYDKNFSDYLNTYDAYLPMTEKPDATTSKKITINFGDTLTLPAIFPHDNATPFADMKVTAFSIDQIQKTDGTSVSDNYVWKGTSNGNNSFVYKMNERMQIKFGTTTQGKDNEVTLKAQAGLYCVRIVVEEDQPVFLGDNSKYSGGYPQTKTKYLYFYVEDSNTFSCGKANAANKYQDANSPVIDENNLFQVSDVYLWEGHTFDFPAPTYSDAHTPTDDIQVDYYLVANVTNNGETTNKVVAKLDYTVGLSRVTVDLDKLHNENGVDVLYDNDFKTTLSEANKWYIYAVARNFNGMQANLQYDYIKTDATEESLDGTHFTTKLFAMNEYDRAAIAQYGYAWKRAEFNFYNAPKTDAKKTATITVTMDDTNNKYLAGEAVAISSIKTEWKKGSTATEVDGQMSAAVYMVKANNVLVPVDIVNGDGANAEVVSSVAFKGEDHEVTNWYFTPGVSGTYLLVVTAKDHADDQVFTNITTLAIVANGDYGVRPRSLSTSAASSETIDKTMNQGASLTLPDYDILDSANQPKYAGKNRYLYEYDTDGNFVPVSDSDATPKVVGYYTITVMGVTDPNCITGNKFVPNNYGKYKFQYDFYLSLSGTNNLIKTVNYIVQVNEASSTSNILMGENYDAKKILKNVAEADEGQTIGNDKNGKFTYTLGSEITGTSTNSGTASTPAYAITLNQFTMSNYGAATDFVVDSAFLYDYLEPIVEGGKITGYMYPAIAIPMPNVVTDTISSDEVEITVQKSGSSSYLVSSKKLNAGGNSNQASVIDQINDFYVFRPDGTFTADCKTKYTPNDYLLKQNVVNNAAGVYTVTYKTNSTSVNFNITFGNLQNGEISWNDDADNNEWFLSYKNGKKTAGITESSDALVIDKDSNGHRYVTIDMTKVFFTGNDDMVKLIEQGPNSDGSTDGINSEKLATEYYWKNVNVTVSYEDGSFIDYADWSDDKDETKAIKDHDNFQYKFDLTQGSGTYKVTIRMTNSYTSTPVTKSIEFTLDAESTNKNVNLNTVWGIILIVLSVGLLAGVIFYFVKTAHATRFVDTPRAIKGKDKKVKNPTTKAVAALKDAEPTKDVEAPKKDAE